MGVIFPSLVVATLSINRRNLIFDKFIFFVSFLSFPNYPSDNPFYLINTSSDIAIPMGKIF